MTTPVTTAPQKDLRPQARPARWRLRIPPGAAEFILLFSASLLRFLYYGFRYFPQLDDYIQYYKYPRFAPLGEMIERLGLFASRPLAGVADICVWGRFWDAGMLPAVLLLALLWCGSILLFRRVFDRCFGCGTLFSVLCLLLPLNLEGTYWISAASRVVCGLFFCALSLFLLCRFLERKHWLNAVGFALAQLLAFSFYEQTLALAGAAAIGMTLLFFRRPGPSVAACGLTLFNLAAYFTFTGLHATGSLAGRMNTILPWDPGYFSDFLPNLLGQFRDAFAGGFPILGRGFWRGIKIIAADGGWWYLLLFLLLAVGALLYACTPHGENGRSVRRIGSRPAAYAFALLCTAAPLTPFLIVANPWFSLRNTVPSLIGLALLCDLALRDLFTHHARTASRTAAALAALLTLTCGVASVSELHDYRETHLYDTAVLDVLAENFDGAPGRIGILGLNPSNLDEQNYFYHEHVHGITQSDWAIQGALWSMTEQVPQIIPLATDTSPYYVDWNRTSKRVDGFDALYLWDAKSLTLTPLTVTGSPESGWTLSAPDGSIAATVTEQNGWGYIE
ncbi:MAG: glucosyltransferase domain-containing protein [Clostridia bacterium]|nr:glucosyltransferase domain-containing protein [Clostridia bacterium]